MKILVTGFDPFGSLKSNISGELATNIDGNSFLDTKIVGRVLRTSFESVSQDLPRILTSISPTLVVMLGLDASGSNVKLETQAHNTVQSFIPDNDGALVSDLHIQADGPAVISTIVDTSFVKNYLHRNNISCSISTNAGTFVCNYAYYLALYELTLNKNIPVIFTHIPTSIENADSVVLNLIKALCVAGEA